MDLLTNATDVARMDVDMDGGERRAKRDQILQLIEMSLERRRSIPSTCRQAPHQARA